MTAFDPKQLPRRTVSKSIEGPEGQEVIKMSATLENEADATQVTAVCLSGLESSRVGCRDLTIEVDSVSREIKDQAVAALALLGGPDIPVLAREEDFATRVQLVTGAFFVEIELDWREGACFGFVGPSDGSRVPDGYYLSAGGRRIREHLALALSRGGFDNLAGQLREVTRASGASAMRTQIEAIEAALREVWDVLPALTRGPRASPDDAPRTE